MISNELLYIMCNKIKSVKTKIKMFHVPGQYRKEKKRVNLCKQVQPIALM